MVLILAVAEVERLLDLPQAIALMEQVALEQDADSARKITEIVDAPDGLRLTAGVLGQLDRLCVRVARQPSDLNLLYENVSRQLLAIMGYPLAGLRAAASVAVGVKHLAPASVSSIGVIGSGPIALQGLRGVCAVRPIQRARVFSRNPERRGAFAQKASSELGIPVEAVGTVEGAAAGAGILLSAVGAGATSAVHASQLQRGTLVVGMGSSISEFDRSVYLEATQLVVSGRAQEVEQAATALPTGMAIRSLIADGRLVPEQLVNLAQVIRGEVNPRNGPADLLVYRESRGPAGDVALASWAYERAREQGLGVEFAF